MWAHRRGERWGCGGTLLLQAFVSFLLDVDWGPAPSMKSRQRRVSWVYEAHLSLAEALAELCKRRCGPGLRCVLRVPRTRNISKHRANVWLC